MRDQSSSLSETELTILILTYNEGKNIYVLIENIRKIVNSLKTPYEILVIDANSKDDTVKAAEKAGAKVLIQKEKGFGAALLEGFNEACGKYILTLDADFSHDPQYLLRLWTERDKADILIASRFVKGGGAEIAFGRRVLSLLFNIFFRNFLFPNIKDANSNFRLYKKSTLRSLKIESRDFTVLPEILVNALVLGYKIIEVPFFYKRRKYGESKLKSLRFAYGYLKMFLKLWVLRNSIESVDYDERAYFSKIPVQRYWQRKRYEIITDFVKNEAGLCLDIGCGSSMIFQDLAKRKNIIGLDVNFSRLRYLRNKNQNFALIACSAEYLPIKSSSVDLVIFSNVIEHVKKTTDPVKEVARIMKKNKKLIIATPDYSTFAWPFFELLCDIVKFGRSYKEKHITKYSKKSLLDLLSAYGFNCLVSKYILGAELILLLRKNNS